MSTTTDGPKNRRGTLRDEQKRATRAKLVDAARTLFEERGYAAVTVDDIASVVGCSRATFYVHFASKVEMLKTIGAAGMAASAFAFYIDLDRVLDTNSRVEFTAWLERAFDWFDENKRLLPAWDEAVALETGVPRDSARRYDPTTECHAQVPGPLAGGTARRGTVARRTARESVGAILHTLGRAGDNRCDADSGRRSSDRYLVPRLCLRNRRASASGRG